MTLDQENNVINNKPADREVLKCKVCGDELDADNRSDAGACMQAAYDNGGDMDTVPYPKHA